MIPSNRLCIRWDVVANIPWIAVIIDDFGGAWQFQLKDESEWLNLAQSNISELWTVNVDVAREDVAN